MTCVQEFESWVKLRLYNSGETWQEDAVQRNGGTESAFHSTRVRLYSTLSQQGPAIFYSGTRAVDGQTADLLLNMLATVPVSLSGDPLPCVIFKPPHFSSQKILTNELSFGIFAKRG